MSRAPSSLRPAAAGPLNRRTLLGGAGAGIAARALGGIGGMASIASVSHAQSRIAVTPLAERLSLLTGTGGNQLALATDDGLVLVDSGAPGQAGNLLRFIDSEFGGAPVRVRLRSKKIDYGWLTARPDGSVDAAELRGIDPDLRVKPFFAEGSAFSIRQFVVGAFNDEMGLQAADPDLAAAAVGTEGRSRGARIGAGEDRGELPRCGLRRGLGHRLGAGASTSGGQRTPPGGAARVEPCRARDPLAAWRGRAASPAYGSPARTSARRAARRSCSSTTAARDGRRASPPSEHGRACVATDRPNPVGWSDSAVQ